MHSPSWEAATGASTSAGRGLTRATLAAATHRLAAADPMLRSIVDEKGVPPIWARRPGFPALVRIILEQQVSLAAAATMYKRLETAAGAIAPHDLLGLGTEGMRALGFTRQKTRFVLTLAERLHTGMLDLALVSRAPIDEARAMLLAIPGLGPWSVDIYALMALRRPDIWPQGDLALAITLRERLGLATNPSRDEQRAIAERWAPWRSVAARIIWTDYLGKRGRL